MNVEMGWTIGDADAQHAAGLGVGLMGGQLERPAVIFGGDHSPAEPGGQPRDADRHRGSTALENAAAGPPWLSKMRLAHAPASLWVFSGLSTACSDGPLIDSVGFKYHGEILGVTSLE